MSIRTDFDNDGFVILRHVLSQDEISLLSLRLAILLHEHSHELEPGDIYYEADGRVKTVSRLHMKDRFFETFMEDERLADLAGQAFGKYAFAHDTSYFPKYAHSDSETPMHQDNAFDCLEPPESLVMTIAIDWTLPENGPLTCFKGSHLMGLLPHKASGLPGFSQMLDPEESIVLGAKVPFYLQSGDITMHHANTVHFSDANKSSHNRRQFAIVYRTRDARVDEIRWAKYKADLKALHDSLTDLASENRK